MERVSSGHPQQPEIADPLNALVPGLSLEQKRVLLHPADMAELSMAGYIDRWRTLHPQYVSHATRQGFRDHIPLTAHNEGFKDFHTGFTDALQDHKMLRTPQAIRNFKIGDYGGLRDWLAKEALQADTAKEAYFALADLFFGDALYPDKTAVHFASQEVAHWYYGGETNNEVSLSTRPTSLHHSIPLR